MKDSTLLGLIVSAIYFIPLVIAVILEIKETTGGVPYMRNPPAPPKRNENIGNNYQPTIDNTTQPPK